MEYKFPSFIDTEQIELFREEKNDCSIRLFLKLPIKGRKTKKPKTLLVVMKNPSMANKKRSDKTVANLCRYIKVNPELEDVTIIIVVNMYPIYKKDSSQLYSLVCKYDISGHLRDSGTDEHGDKKIQELIQHSDFILFAFGGRPENMPISVYRKRVQHMYSLTLRSPNLKNKRLFRIKHDQAEFPFHPQGIGYTTEQHLKKFKLIECEITSDREVLVLKKKI